MPELCTYEIYLLHLYFSTYILEVWTLVSDAYLAPG